MTIPLDAPMATTINITATSKEAKAAARMNRFPLLTISSHSRGAGSKRPRSTVIKRLGDDIVTASIRQLRPVRSYSITAFITDVDA
jgi:hypothetical protein